jgi:hypothetical protein
VPQRSRSPESRAASSGYEKNGDDHEQGCRADGDPESWSVIADYDEREANDPSGASLDRRRK